MHAKLWNLPYARLWVPTAVVVAFFSALFLLPQRRHIRHLTQEKRQQLAEAESLQRQLEGQQAQVERDRQLVSKLQPSSGDTSDRVHFTATSPRRTNLQHVRQILASFAKHGVACAHTTNAQADPNSPGKTRTVQRFTLDGRFQDVLSALEEMSLQQPMSTVVELSMTRPNHYQSCEWTLAVELEEPIE